MTKLQELKAKLATQSAERKAIIAETIEERKIEMQLTKLDSPSYLEREVSKANSLTLTAVISAFEDLEAGNDKPVKMVFGYGSQVDKILTIARSLQFAKRDYRDLMEDIAGLDEDLVEETLEALGSPAYYSMKEDEIIQAISPDLETLRTNVKVLATDLGVTDIKLHKLNTVNIEKMYARSEVKAKELMENTRNYDESAEETTYAV